MTKFKYVVLSMDSVRATTVKKNKAAKAAKKKEAELAEFEKLKAKYG